MAYTGSNYKDKVGEVVADVNSYYYDEAEDRFGRGECTWYAFGRTIERCGIRLEIPAGMGNGGQWYDTVVKKSNVTKRSKYSRPISRSLASFSDSSAGHIVFIEQVAGNYVYFTEGNSWCEDGQVQKKSIKDFETLWGKELEGYITFGKENPGTGR